MKKIFSLSFIMALLVCCSTVMAQNNNKHNANTKVKKDNNAAAVETPRPFKGVVRYKMTDAKPVQRKPLVAKERGLRANVVNGDATDNNTAVNTDATRDKTPNAFIAFDEKNTFGFVNGIIVCTREEGLGFFSVNSPDGKIITCDAPIVKMYETNPDEEAYTRTQEHRVIAGVNATKYICNLPGMEGELWVAEEYEATNSALPYIGLNHPILEGDFVVPLHGEVLYRAHIVAEKVVFDEIPRDVVRFRLNLAADSRISEGEFADMIKNLYHF